MRNDAHRPQGAAGVDVVQLLARWQRRHARQFAVDEVAVAPVIGREVALEDARIKVRMGAVRVGDVLGRDGALGEAVACH